VKAGDGVHFQLISGENPCPKSLNAKLFAADHSAVMTFLPTASPLFLSLCLSFYLSLYTRLDLSLALTLAYPLALALAPCGLTLPQFTSISMVFPSRGQTN
jgi:hypothetical protein